MRVRVSVVPKSGRFALSVREGELRVHLKSPPENNKANLELAKKLSKALGCDVYVVSGHSSRRKTLEIDIPPERWEAFLASIK